MSAEHKYGEKSMARLNTCHPKLKDVALLALQLSPYDITIIHGHRGQEIQDALFESGASTKKFPFSKHNVLGEDGEPRSEAIDFGPWVNGGIPWQETHIFAVLAGCFMAAAAELNVTLRWGGDWNTNGLTSDQSLLDWGHVEIIL